MEHMQILHEIGEQCLRCGSCASVCDILPALKPRLPGDIADEIARGEIDQRLEWFIPRCSLCGLCVQACPNSLDTVSMVLETRAAFIKDGRITQAPYRAMAVDQEWNAITLFRNQYGIDLSEYELESSETAFLASCTLINEAPELMFKTHQWLEEALGEKISLISDCCGMPLQEMGLFERYEAYSDALWEKLQRMGVGRLIVVCPNCLGRLAHRGSQAGISTVSVYQLMATMGLRAPKLEGKRITIHDSCPARGSQMGAWVREILSLNDIVETAFCGDASRCCGSGGAVGMYDYVLSGIRAKKRLDELLATEADLIVTYCMSSCSTLTLPEAGGKVHHLLELVFGMHIDHEAYAARVAELWSGESAAQNNALIATDSPLLPR